MKIRPLPESLLQVFENKLKTQEFNLTPHLSVDEMVHRFQNITNQLSDEIFPERNILLNSEDKPWFKRLRLREHNKRGRTKKYLTLPGRGGLFSPPP